MLKIDWKLIDERIEERLHKTQRRDGRTPGKAGAVFLLLNESQERKGTCFAINYTHVITARHNIFKGNEEINPNAVVFIQLGAVYPPQPASTSSNIPTMVSPVERLEIVAGGNSTGAYTEDWLILKRTDKETFRNFISIRVTDESDMKQYLPYITIYHFPLDFHALEKLMLFMDHTENRVGDSQNGLLICQEHCSTVTGGSCGAPYVENSSGDAIGLHLYSASATKSVSKSLVSAIQDRPYGLHFLQGTSVVEALQALRNVKP